jgi:pantothenate kinase
MRNADVRTLALAELADAIVRRAGDKRLVVTLAGPPGVGKSTTAGALLELLCDGDANRAALVSMDGYHLDNAVLAARGRLAAKGAPDTFDAPALQAALARIAAGKDTVVPVFDRALDFSRAAAAVVPAHARFVLVEGNYLLLDDEPWRRLAPFFGYSVFLSESENELERRLVRRWLDLGHDEAAAIARVKANDMPNVALTLARSRQPDLLARVSPARQ